MPNAVIFATSFLELVKIPPIRFRIQCPFLLDGIVHPVLILINQREGICPNKIFFILNFHIHHIAIVGIILPINSFFENLAQSSSFVAFELHIFEVIGAIILPLVNHAPDDTFAVLRVRPLEARCVIVQTIPHFPCVQVSVCEIAVAISGTLDGFGFLGKSVAACGHDQQIKRMPCATCLGVVCNGCHVVGDAVPLTGNQSAIVPERNQLRIGDMLNAFEVVRELIPQLSNSPYNSLACSRQSIVGFVLFTANVLMLRQVVSHRLVHSIVVMVRGCFSGKCIRQTFNSSYRVTMGT